MSFAIPFFGIIIIPGKLVNSLISINCKNTFHTIIRAILTYNNFEDCAGLSPLSIFPTLIEHITIFLERKNHTGFKLRSSTRNDFPGSAG